MNAALSDHKMYTKSLCHVHIPIIATRSTGDNDDNHKALNLEHTSNGMDTGLNVQHYVWHPPLGQFLMFYDMNSVPP